MPEAGLVSVDALAVYRKMDIGTEKPSRPTDPASRHEWHLVDLADASEDFSVFSFQREARQVLSGLHAASRPAILVGGTGLYHRAVVDDLELPGRYPAVADRLHAEAGAPGGARRLHARLRELDPVAAGRMEPLNVRRVIRALEVTEGSGRRFSDFGPGLEVYPPTETVMIGLSVERERLDARLAERLAAQVEEGFLDEVRALTASPAGLSRTARQAIGYRELLAYLEGTCSFSEALAEALRRLRNFARRQQAWFKRDPRIHWLEADRDDLVGAVVSRWETRAG